MNVNDPRTSHLAQLVARENKMSEGRARAFLATSRRVPIARTLNGEDSQALEASKNANDSRGDSGGHAGGKLMGTSGGRSRSGRAAFTTDTSNKQSMEASGNSADVRGETGKRRGPAAGKTRDKGGKPYVKSADSYSPQMEEADTTMADSTGEPSAGAGSFPAKGKTKPKIGTGTGYAPGHARVPPYKPKKSAKAEATTPPDGARGQSRIVKSSGNGYGGGDGSYE